MPTIHNSIDIFSSIEINFMRKCVEVSTDCLVVNKKSYDSDHLLSTVFSLYRNGIRDQKYLISLAMQIVSAEKSAPRISRMLHPANNN